MKSPRLLLKLRWTLTAGGCGLHLVSDQRAAASSQGPTPAKKPTTASAEEEEEGRGEDQRPKKRRHVHADEELQVNTTPPSTRRCRHSCACDLQEVPEYSRAEVSEESDSLSVEADEEGGAEPHARQPQDRELEKTKSQSSSSASATPRTPCPYGKECYRYVQGGGSDLSQVGLLSLLHV